MSTFSNTAREVEMPNGDIVKLHDAVTPNSTSNIKKFKYDDNGHVTESTAADAEDLNLSGYSTPTTGSTDIGASDDVQTAIGKLDHQSHIDQTNIWYAINTGVKNILPINVNALKAVNSNGSWTENSYLYNGVRYTVNADGSITITRTSSSSSDSSLNLELSVGNKYVGYYLSGGSDYCAIIMLTAGGNTALAVRGTANVVPSNATGNMNLYVRSSDNPDNHTVYPMISYMNDSEYKPYALPNYDLTQLEQQDRNALVEVIDNGAKNLIDLSDLDAIKALNTYGSWNGNVYTYDNATTFTFNEDGTIGVATVGTIQSQAVCNLIVPTTLINGEEYVISGCPAGGSSGATNGYMLDYQYNRGGSVYYILDTGDGATFNYSSSDSVVKILIIIRPQTNISSSLVFKPMICTKADWKISKNFAPYSLPNTDLTRMVSELQKKSVKVYTYHVNPNESDPEDAVTYLDDATGLTPAKMGASSFSYGSWANAWFLPRPCMLKSDGTVAYYLNPNDYSKKTDGTASDIADANFDGNVMLEFPKIWVKRVDEGNGARTVSIAPVNVDGTYKCWSNINAEDKEVDHFYLPVYNGTIHSSKMRSLSGVTLNTTYAPNYIRAQEVTAATANNPTGKNLWYTETWADFCLIYDLLYLMGKSLDVQRTFGQGLSSGSETAMRAYVTGTHNAKGLFYGDVSGTSTAVKVLGMENLWGCRWHGVAGLINDNGTLKVKMTYGVADGSTAVGYNTTGSGYLNYGSTYGTAGYVKKMQADNTMGYKIIETAGTDATYYCDYYYTNNSQSNYARLGGGSGIGAGCGFCVNLYDGAALTHWNVGGSLSCRPEV